MEDAERMMDAPDLRFELVDGNRIVRLGGEIDASNAWAVSRTIREAISNHDLRVVLNLSDVSYLDSAGIQMLFDLKRILHDHAQDLVLVVPAEAPIRRTLEVSAVIGTISVAESVEVAAGGPSPS
jgi:anti-anti-sigma factor